VSNDVELRNATDDTIADNPSVSNNEITLTASPSTSTVYLDGQVTVRSPNVNTDKDYQFTINASDVEQDAVQTETITVLNDPLSVSSATAFEPTSVDEETEQRYRFNYSFGGVDTGNDTTYSIAVPSEFTIEGSDISVKNASGQELTSSVSQSGNTLELTTGTDTETVYLDGSVNLTSPAVPEGQEQADYDLTVSASDNSRNVDTTETITVNFQGGQPGDPELESAIQ
jgi:hypothetical protein